MRASALIVFGLIVVLLAAPFVLRDDAPHHADADHRLIIVTPHNEQIRYEFARAFEQWFPQQQETLGQTVEVVWNIPGGTSEIRRMLESQFAASLREGRPVGGAADLMFGGGQYDHDKLKEGVAVAVDGRPRATSISEPVAFDAAFLDGVYGENDLAGSALYDPDGHWYGTALSSFGILSNLEALQEINVSPPQVWDELCHPDLAGWIGLGNPAQSGSIRKSFDTILQHYGWVDGWRVLRRMGANARYFVASSSKVPIDVSRGDAAAGVCIDFYGRYQAQAIADAGDPDRLQYVDPPGLTAIDADPISLLRGAPNRDIAIMFIRFCLTERAQALWQFPRGSASEWRPDRFELRRMPVRRSMYANHIDQFVDQVNPFETARAFEHFDPNTWSFVSIIFSSMVIENHDSLREAWNAVTTHPAFDRATARALAAGRTRVTPDDSDDETLAAMLEAFDAMPRIAGPNDEEEYNLNDPDDLAAIHDGWLRGGSGDADLWPAEADPESRLRAEMTRFFNKKYKRIIELGR